jgi:hypothetical protein
VSLAACSSSNTIWSAPHGIDDPAGGKTGWGEVKTAELISITRPVLAATLGDVGLSLAEAESLLAGLQEAMVRAQVARAAGRQRARFRIYCRIIEKNCDHEFLIPKGSTGSCRRFSPSKQQRDADHPGLIEMHRAEDDTCSWIEESGAYHHQTTGDLGGLWRRLGRSPNGSALRACG